MTSAPWFVVCVKRQDASDAVSGGIAWFGIARSPEAEAETHLSRSEMIKRIDGSELFYSAATDSPNDSKRWARLETQYKSGETIVKAETTYDSDTYLSKKVRCSHNA